MITNGCISRKTFDYDKIAKDTDSQGRIVERGNNPNLENRHRDKSYLQINKSVSAII